MEISKLPERIALLEVCIEALIKEFNDDCEGLIEVTDIRMNSSGEVTASVNFKRPELSVYKEKQKIS